jgi:hypothetical protein
VFQNNLQEGFKVGKKAAGPAGLRKAEKFTLPLVGYPGRFGISAL